MKRLLLRALSKHPPAEPEFFGELSYHAALSHRLALAPPISGFPAATGGTSRRPSSAHPWGACRPASARLQKLP